MNVKASCSSCGAQFAAQPHLYGKSVACPTCGGVVAVPDPNRASGTVAPLADPYGGLPTQQPAATDAPLQPTYRPGPTDTGMGASDKRLVWYAVTGAGGILLLLVGAISVSRLISGGSEQSTVGDQLDTAAATATDGEEMGRTGVAGSSATASGDETNRPDTQSEGGAGAATSHVPDRPAEPAGERRISEKSRAQPETSSHSPAPAANARLGTAFADLADNERKAFIDDLKARLKELKREAQAAVAGGSREAIGFLQVKVNLTPLVVLADHGIEPTEFPSLVEYAFDRGWIQEEELPVSRAALAQSKTSQRESLSPTEEELLKVIANISLERRKTIIDEFNRLYVKYCDPAHKRELARGLISLQTKYGLTGEQLGTIRMDAANRGWTVMF